MSLAWDGGLFVAAVRVVVLSGIASAVSPVSQVSNSWGNLYSANVAVAPHWETRARFERRPVWREGNGPFCDRISGLLPMIRILTPEPDQGI